MKKIMMNVWQEKCSEYWPKALHDRITPGGRLSVTLTSTIPYAEFQIRKFIVKSVSENNF